MKASRIGPRARHLATEQQSRERVCRVRRMSMSQARNGHRSDGQTRHYSAAARRAHGDALPNSQEEMARKHARLFDPAELSHAPPTASRRVARPLRRPTPRICAFHRIKGSIGLYRCIRAAVGDTAVTDPLRALRIIPHRFSPPSSSCYRRACQHLSRSPWSCCTRADRMRARGMRGWRGH